MTRTAPGSGQPHTAPSDRPSLRAALAERVVVADGAMGSMLQGAPVTLEDFEDHEGCNEILNVTRPDVVTGIHQAYLAAGADCITTNTFGANLGNLGEYDIQHRIAELAESGARLARQAADAAATPDRPRWVLGSIGPGTKLPTLGHAPFARLRDTYVEAAAALLRGGADALIIETCQDLLQAKAAIIGARRAIAGLDDARDVLVIAQVTIETTGSMLLGTEIGAALTALEPLGIDMIGLNCATGPAEMSEHLRYLAAHSRLPLSCMPNAGLPELTADGAYYPVQPGELADAHEMFTREFGLALAGGCCGTTPEHIAELSGAAVRPPAGRPAPAARARRGLALPARAVPPGHRVPGHRRADQRQRLQGLPRGHAGRALRGLRGDRPRADPRRRAPAGRLHRLRRPGRRRRHGGGGQPPGNGSHPAAGAGLHRAGGHRDRAGAARRPRGGQLGQLRGRRRAAVADRAGHAAGPRARRRGHRADHRRAGPGPDR